MISTNTLHGSKTSTGARFGTLLAQVTDFTPLRGSNIQAAGSAALRTGMNKPTILSNSHAAGPLIPQCNKNKYDAGSRQCCRNDLVGPRLQFVVLFPSRRCWTHPPSTGRVQRLM